MNNCMMIMAVAVVVCGCVANQPIPKGIDSLTDEDIGMMVVRSMDKIYRGVNDGRIAKKSPNARIVAKIQPFEMSNLANDARAKEVVSELERRLCTEMAAGGWFFFPDASSGTASGAMLQPDCILKGKLSCIITENGAFSDSEFRLQLSIVDVSTGIVVWEGKITLVKRTQS